MSRAKDPSIPEGTLPLTPVVLHILLALADGPSHGYRIAQDVEQLTEGQIRLGPGTLYGSLLRMVKTGLIEDVPTSGRASALSERRREYRITRMGRYAIDLELRRLGRVVAHARRRQLLRERPA